MSKRDYLFRGKIKDGEHKGKRVFGDLYHHKSGAIVITSDGVNYEVIPETVGEFTGLLDKNGVKIFEEDIIFIPREAGTFKRDTIGLVTYDNGVIWVIGLDNAFSIGLYILNVKLINVIGNIHDNKELLGKEKKEGD